MDMQVFSLNDWSDSSVIYNGMSYKLNPYKKQDLPTLTLDDIECINSDCVNFDCTTFQRIRKIQKATHQNILENKLSVLTLTFSSEYNKALKKYSFVQDAFSEIKELFINYQDADVPEIEIYSKNIFGIELTGCQVHKIRCLLKDRIFNGSLTYDHIYPPDEPLARFNSNNICVLADAIGSFYFWLRDLNTLFDKNDLTICKAAHFNPDIKGIDDYLNFMDAYYTDNLYATIQAAFVETCNFKNLSLAITNSKEFHLVYVSRKIWKLKRLIDEQFRKTKDSKRTEFICPVYFQLKQILNKAKKRLYEYNEKPNVKADFNTDNAVYESLQTLLVEMEEYYRPLIEKKIVFDIPHSLDDFNDKAPVISLTYKHWATDGRAINSLYKAMKKSGDITINTTYEDFKNAFSNNPVNSKIGLNYLKGMAYYFFIQLKAKHKILDKDIWVGISNAFYLTEDIEYDLTQLAHQKLPKTKTLAMTKIDTLVNSI